MPQSMKPPALSAGDGIRVISIASPAQEEHLKKGCDELTRLGFTPIVDRERALAHSGLFAGSAADRLQAFHQALGDPSAKAIFCSRGGYGSTYLLDGLSLRPPVAKILLGSSDITSLQIFLWQKFRWVVFYGPMVASNFDRGAGAPHGYDPGSFASALTQSANAWTVGLQGQSLTEGSGQGVLLGGCLTLIESTLGTPWELDTTGAILVIEDRGMKPYQVDRALMHLKQAGKFRALAGVVLGDFPDCREPEGGESVEDVARRILTPLGIPIVWGAPIGHTFRPALTLPLGVRAEISTAHGGTLRILETACS
jgi:muramoyltetrapeptide carboxypeptidase